MSYWEEVCLYAANNPHSDFIVCYGRYIDDLFLVWNSDCSLLPVFLQYLNTNIYNLTFTLTYHKDQINFLDVTLYGTNNKVENTLLQADSCHPFHTVRNLPIGEFVRAIKALSTQGHLEKEFQLIEHRLAQQGYTKKLLFVPKILLLVKTGTII